jgi:hypothetical protein
MFVLCSKDKRQSQDNPDKETSVNKVQRENNRIIKKVAEQSKAWVCGRSLAGTAGSNPAGGMDVCLL